MKLKTKCHNIHLRGCIKKCCLQDISHPIPTSIMVCASSSSFWSRERWVNSLWLSDAIWRHRSGSTLAQVVAWCHQASSHYLIQCWFIICEVLWNSPERNFTVSKLLFCIMILKIILFKFPPNLPGSNELMWSCAWINNFNMLQIKKAVTVK